MDVLKINDDDDDDDDEGTHMVQSGVNEASGRTKDDLYGCHHHHHHHHHRFNIHSLPRLIKSMDGCFPTAIGRQSTFSNILGSLV